MMNSLVLMRDGAAVAERILNEQPIEIGRAASCDLVVDDPELPARALLVHARGGTVWWFELSVPRAKAQVLAIDRPLPLGAHHQLVRRLVQATARDGAAGTKPLDRAEALGLARYAVLVGRGAEARRIAIAERPLRVGKGSHNDLVLSDPTVSTEHCRFALAGTELTVRDLDSRNGTYVQGVRVDRARLSAGAQVRVGRTDLLVVAQPRGGDEVGHEAEPPLIAASPAMQEVVGDARRFAALPWPLLVLGESGVGKEELAALVHREGPRRRGAFVALNAGGLPRELVESELFGHERGAFTGAHAQRRGVFEQADGGTLFLDEIGELPLALQSRLLRVLETFQVRRVGGEADVAVDVRVVCATHRDLAQMVHAGSFRQDLYYRLARLVLKVPPLAARPDDVLPLAARFLRGLAPELGLRTLSRGAEARLLLHGWPGNARELRNVLCAAAALSGGVVLEPEDITRAIARVSGPLAPAALDGGQIASAVARYGGNLSAVSRALAIPRSTLRDRLRRSRDPDEPDDGAR